MNDLVGSLSWKQKPTLAHSRVYLIGSSYLCTIPEHVSNTRTFYPLSPQSIFSQVLELQFQITLVYLYPRGWRCSSKDLWSQPSPTAGQFDSVHLPDLLLTPPGAASDTVSLHLLTKRSRSCIKLGYSVRFTWKKAKELFRDQCRLYRNFWDSRFVCYARLDCWSLRNECDGHSFGMGEWVGPF